MSARDDLLALARQTLMPGFEGPTLPSWLAARLRDGLGGVCLFATNVESPAQLRALTAAILAANPDAVISIDEEGGDVTRLHAAVGSPYPGAAVLGRIDDEAVTLDVARAVGIALRDAGIGLTLAPDADVNSNPDNPVIGVRSFGADAALVARHTMAWVRGVQREGVAASVKHFPGHGDTDADSHLALPVVDRSLAALEERELAPFVAAIAAGARTIMTSHILLPQLDDVPATLSRVILTGLLRERLGFDGAIVSDALDMHGASGVTGIPTAAARALAAGCDLLCIGTDNDDAQLAEIEAAIADAVESGELPLGRLREAAGRCRALGGAPAAPVASLPAPALPSPSVIAQVFDVRGDAGMTDRAPAFVEVVSARNIAVGVVPFGPFAAGAPLAATLDGAAGISAVLALPADALPVLVGRELHLRPWLPAAVEAIRAERDVLVVEMGWPDPGFGYDIATFGGSAVVGEALVQMLERAL